MPEADFLDDIFYMFDNRDRIPNVNIYDDFLMQCNNEAIRKRFIEIYEIHEEDGTYEWGIDQELGSIFGHGNVDIDKLPEITKTFKI